MNNRRWTPDEETALRLLVERDQRDPLTAEEFIAQFRSLTGAERSPAALNKRLWLMRRAGVQMRPELVNLLSAAEVSARMSTMAAMPEPAPAPQETPHPAAPLADVRSVLANVEQLVAAGLLDPKSALAAVKVLL